MASRSSKAALFAAVALGSLLVAAESSAAEDEAAAEPIRLDYTAHATCPSRDEVLRRIRAYTTRWKLAAEGEQARRFVLRIDRRSAKFVGRFVVTTNGRDVVRDFEGTECDDVATGLAVVAALAIDPHASLVPSGSEEAPGLERPSAEPSAEPAPVPLVEPTVEPPVVLPHARERTGALVGRAAPSSKAPPRVAFSVGSRVEANHAVSGLLADVGVYFEAAWSPPVARVRWLAPALRIGARYSFTRTAEVGETDVGVSWRAGFVEACPVRVALGARAEVDACVAANAGVLSAKARNVPRAGDVVRPWFDYGAVATARWFAYRQLFVDALAAVVLPLVREQLSIEPDGVFTVAPAVGWSLGAGLGWRF